MSYLDVPALPARVVDWVLEIQNVEREAAAEGSAT